MLTSTRFARCQISVPLNGIPGLTTYRVHRLYLTVFYLQSVIFSSGTLFLTCLFFNIFSPISSQLKIEMLKNNASSFLFIFFVYKISLCFGDGQCTSLISVYKVNDGSEDIVYRVKIFGDLGIFWPVRVPRKSAPSRKFKWLCFLQRSVDKNGTPKIERIRIDVLDFPAVQVRKNRSSILYT